MKNGNGRRKREHMKYCRAKSDRKACLGMDQAVTRALAPLWEAARMPAWAWMVRAGGRGQVGGMSAMGVDARDGMAGAMVVGRARSKR